MWHLMPEFTTFLVGTVADGGIGVGVCLEDVTSGDAIVMLENLTETGNVKWDHVCIGRYHNGWL